MGIFHCFLYVYQRVPSVDAGASDVSSKSGASLDEADEADDGEMPERSCYVL